MSLLVAVPFQEGVLLALGTPPGQGGGSPRGGGPRRRVHKLGWGLLAGTETLERAQRDLLVPAARRGRGPARGTDGFSSAEAAEEIARCAETLTQPDSEWVYTYEPAYEAGGQELPVSVRDEHHLGEPVRLYSYRSGADAAPRLVSWGLLIPPPSVSEDLSQEARLRLQWELEQGTGLDERLRAVLSIFNWVGERSEALGPELDVGLHESDRRFTVDRMRWGL